MEPSVDAGSGSDLTFEDFATWTVISLKAYISRRGMKVTGTKNDLAARALAAYELNLPIHATATEMEQQRIADYKNILLQSGLPDNFDPTVATDGYLTEEESVNKWPEITDGDLLELMGTDSKLASYKTDKAYRHYRAGWVGQVHMKEFDNIYLLKNECMPSERVNDPPHKVWMTYSKTILKITAAFCTCAAGLNQNCNHICGMLFRMQEVSESERVEELEPVTSRLCQWNKPPSKAAIKSARIESLLTGWYRKRYKCKTPIKRVLSEKRSLYTPSRQSTVYMNRFQMNKLSKKHFGKSALKYAMEIVPKKPKQTAKDDNNNDDPEIVVGVDVPNTMFPDLPTIDTITMDSDQPGNVAVLPLPPTMKMAAQLYIDNCKSTSRPITSEGFALKLCDYFPDNVLANLQTLTCSQSQSDLWFQNRLGRITGSKFGRVASRQRTIRTSKSVQDTTAVLRELLEKTDLNTAAMAYGRKSEPLAKRTYLDIYSGTHTNLRIEEVGLTVLKENPMLAASPDGIIHCDCCESRVLEVKCPFTIRYSKPTIVSESAKDNNVPYLFRDSKTNDGLKLRLKHAYHIYEQVQGEMACTNLKRAELFVWSPFGHVTVPVAFDGLYWAALQKDLVDFFVGTLGAELLRMCTLQSTFSESNPGGMCSVCREHAANLNNVCVHCEADMAVQSILPDD